MRSNLWQHAPGLLPLRHCLADEYEPERLVPRKRGLFSRDCEQACCLQIQGCACFDCLSHLHPAVSEMMHGFGDGKPPFTESVEHVEVRHMSWDA